MISGEIRLVFEYDKCIYGNVEIAADNYIEETTKISDIVCDLGMNQSVWIIGKTPSFCTFATSFSNAISKSLENIVTPLGKLNLLK